MLGVILARVDIVSLKFTSFTDIFICKIILPQVEDGHYEEVDSLLYHCALMPHPLLQSLFRFEYWLQVKLIIGQH